jgi:hemolysin III
MSNIAKTYTPSEERINVVSHATGLALSIVALLLLLKRAMHYEGLWPLFSVGLFGVSLIALYAASTAYHSTTQPDLRRRLRIVDHAAIYLLIAGTYTPFALLILKGTTGWVIFAVAWLMAVLGITLKLFFTGRYTLVSTLLYVFMGWIILFVIRPLVENLSPEGLRWLIAGGVAYTVGALVYMLKNLNYSHAIFHVFILIGSVCHFIAVYFYVLPSLPGG